MFSSTGAVKELGYKAVNNGMIEIKIKGHGIFGTYSSIKPKGINRSEWRRSGVYTQWSVWFTNILTMNRIEEFTKWSVIEVLWWRC